MQKLTDDFINKYGEDVEIYWDEDTGFLEIIRSLDLSGAGEPKDKAFSFLSENSLFFGIDINDLEFSQVVHSKYTDKVDFKQFYKGVPVLDGKIWINIETSDKSTSSIFFRKYYYCLDLDVVPTITKEAASQIIMNDLGAPELFNEVETPVSPQSLFSEYLPTINDDELLAYPSFAPPQGSIPQGNMFYSSPFISPPSPPVSYSYIGLQRRIVKLPALTKLLIYPKEEAAYLCWEFIFNQGDKMGYWFYYIDAHTGKIVHNYNSRPLPIGQSETSSNTPSPNANSNNSYPYPDS